MVQSFKITPGTATKLADALALVGTDIEINGEWYNVHSVEGVTWYVWADKAGQVNADLDMTPTPWRHDPAVYITPAGIRPGEGFGREIHLSSLKKSQVQV